MGRATLSLGRLFRLLVLKHLGTRAAVPRLAPSLVFGAWVAGVVVLFASASCYVGANSFGEIRLLEPYRQAMIDEVFAACPIEYALTSREANDVIFVGDSTCRCGIDTRYFETLTGRKAYNLGGLASLGVAGPLTTTRAYLEHHPVPLAVVLCLSPIQMLCMASNRRRRKPGELEQRFLRAYGAPSQHPGVFAGGCDSLLYFIKRGTLVAGNSAGGYFGWGARDPRGEPVFGYPPTKTFDTIKSDLHRLRGYFPLPGRGGPIDLPRPATPTAIHPELDQAARECARSADRLGFRLMIQPMPLNAGASLDVAAIESWLHALQVEFPRIAVGRPRVMRYDGSLCWDGLHLNAAGVERFTEHLAKEVIEQAAPTRPAKTSGRSVSMQRGP